MRTQFSHLCVGFRVLPFLAAIVRVGLSLPRLGCEESEQGAIREENLGNHALAALAPAPSVSRPSLTLSHCSSLIHLPPPVRPHRF